MQLVGNVGTDNFGEFLTGALARLGVDVVARESRPMLMRSTSSRFQGEALVHHHGPPDQRPQRPAVRPQVHPVVLIDDARPEGENRRAAAGHGGEDDSAVIKIFPGITLPTKP